MTFHYSDEQNIRYANTILSRALTDHTITDEDAELINDYITDINGKKSLSSQRVYKYNYILITWRRFIGPYHDQTIRDIYRAKDQMIRTSGFKPDTQRDFVGFLRRFYRWMIDEERTDKMGEKDLRRLDEIELPKANKMKITAEMLLTADEVEKLLRAGKDSMERALIAYLYFGGFRSIEAGDATWRQVQFNEWNVTINTNEKTGMARKVPLVEPLPYISQWRADYIAQYGEPDPNAYLFVNKWGNQLTYKAMAARLKEIADRAGVAKHLTLHLFRHSRITHLRAQGYTDAVIMRMMWGGDSEQLKTYSHLTPDDVEREVAERSGIKTPAKRQKRLEARQCSKCNTINRPTDNYCSTCGLPLTGEAAVSLETANRAAELLPEYKTLLNEFEEKLRQMQQQQHQ